MIRDEDQDKRAPLTIDSMLFWLHTVGEFSVGSQDENITVGTFVAKEGGWRLEERVHTIAPSHMWSATDLVVVSIFGQVFCKFFRSQ